MSKKHLFQITEQLWDYPGGVHPEPNKSISARLPIGEIWLPETLIIPLRQHIGQTGKLKVAIGDQVLAGQALTEPTSGMSVPVHAPTSGTITAIQPTQSNHPSGLQELSIVLQPDGRNRWIERQTRDSIISLTHSDLLKLIQRAGIAGLGGAGFPTLVKLTPQQNIRLLLINGAECEPYITADDTLMQAHAKEVVQGSLVMAQLLGEPTVVIAIENDKPQAIQAIQAAIQSDETGYQNIHLKTIPTKYPSGGEKQLIQIITGEEVPANGLPLDLGVVVQNVGTAYAVQQAVYEEKPLVQRVVTLTGDRVARPGNHWVLLGTPIDELLQHHNIKSGRLIVGGPMMGFELQHLSAPVIKTTNCLIAPGKTELPTAEDEMPCIRCGACAEACPASLLPQQLHWYAQAKDETKLEEHNLFDCIECGACAYVCPSTIPLVLEYRQAKAMIRTAKEEQLKAEKAKQRFEARNSRLEQEKKAREEKHKQAAKARQEAARKIATSGATDEKSAVIAAALARAKAKKQPDVKAQVDEQGQLQPNNADVIAQREARKAQARAAKAAKQQEPESQTETQANDRAAPNDKAAQVAAAIARAKAKREATTKPPVQEGQNEKAAQIAAAVARAKAKREAGPSEPSPKHDEKAARIATAVAKAKEKAAQHLPEAEPEQPQVDLQEAAKKAKIAAAIAKAKAKQMQSQKDNNKS